MPNEHIRPPWLPGYSVISESPNNHPLDISPSPYPSVQLSLILHCLTNHPLGRPVKNFRMGEKENQMQEKIPESQELRNEFDDPFEFMALYIKIYTRQFNHPHKTLARQLPYYLTRFQIDFLNNVLQLAVSEPLDSPLTILAISKELTRWRRTGYYDREFYDFCVSVLVKGFNIILDRAETDILTTAVPSVGSLFYRFSLYPIDLGPFLIERTARSLAFGCHDTVRRLVTDIKELNRSLEGAKPSGIFFVSDRRYVSVTDDGSSVREPERDSAARSEIIDERVAGMIKTRLSDQFIGHRRRMVYDVASIMERAIERMKKDIEGEDVEVRYVRVMDVCGLLAGDDGMEGVVERLKEYGMRLFKDAL